MKIFWDKTLCILEIFGGMYCLICSDNWNSSFAQTVCSVPTQHNRTSHPRRSTILKLEAFKNKHHTTITMNNAQILKLFRKQRLGK
jgi:hypothetical protein